ncbi:hypothetical protein KM043_016226 [Ampulex compressa]|nr:hypothetical protein KM043_016226 [Ampulex compressa]
MARLVRCLSGPTTSAPPAGSLTTDRNSSTRNWMDRAESFRSAWRHSKIIRLNFRDLDFHASVPRMFGIIECHVGLRARPLFLPHGETGPDKDRVPGRHVESSRGRDDLKRNG